jgi:chorismate mutase-like protein
MMGYMQENLRVLRERINVLDERLLTLLNKRAQIALEIGKLKVQTGLKTYDPIREAAVIEHINALNTGPLDKGAVEELFAAILTACREIQSR